MPLMTWNDSYSVRISKIDQQHKQLFELINQLHDAMAAGKGKETLGKVLNGLVDYAVTHFKEEEQMLAKYNFPQLGAQKKQHEYFVAQLTQLQKEHASGKLGVSIQTRDFLKGWLENHIKTTDMSYSIFMLQKGVR